MRSWLEGLPSRLRCMLLGWASVGCAYTFGSFWQGSVATLPETVVDHWISFNPIGIWLYCSFFLLVPAAYLLTETEKLLWLQRAMQLCAGGAGIIFLWCPTTISYPSIPESGVHSEALRFFIRFDTSNNCLPSLHGALTVLSAWALCNRRQQWRSGIYLAWALAILYAVIQLRRHLFIDLSAGVALGLFSGFLASFSTRYYSLSYRRT